VLLPSLPPAYTRNDLYTLISYLRQTEQCCRTYGIEQTHRTTAPGRARVAQPALEQRLTIAEESMNNAAGGEPRSAMARLIAVWKDLIALLRDSALFAIAVLLLLFPTTLNTVLVKAGFEEGSIVGFQWKSKLVESDTALKEARASITDLRSQIDKMAKVLADAEAKLDDPSLKAHIAQLEEESKQLTIASSRVQASVQTTIASTAPLVEKAQAAVSPTPRWGVVFSGDSTLEAARYEIEVAAPKFGIPNASIYLRQGSYRSVAVVEDRAQAEHVLFKAKARRADSYIVNLATWCPRTVEQVGYREYVTA